MPYQLAVCVSQHTIVRLSAHMHQHFAGVQQTESKQTQSILANGTETLIWPLLTVRRELHFVQLCKA